VDTAASDGATTPAARPLAVGSAVVALGLGVGQVLGYLLNVVGARVLGPAAYGELGALLGLLLIGNVLPLAVQTVTARRVATSDGSRADDVPLGVVLGLGETLAVLLVTPLLALVLRLDGVAVAALAVAFLPLSVSGVALGLEQGRQRFRALGVSYAVLAAARSGLALVVLVASGGVRAVAHAILLGSWFGWVAVAALSRMDRPSRRRPARDGIRETGRVGHALLAMFVFTSLDVLLARVILPDEASGQYAAGAILVKVAFWLPQAVAVAAFARLSTGAPGELRRAAGLVAGLGACATVLAAVVGPPVVRAVLGRAYDVAAGAPAVFVLAGSLQALAYLLLMGRLARQDHSAVWAVWGGTATLVVIARLLATDPLSLAWCVVGSAALVCLGGALLPQRAVPTKGELG
jgi:O-antigen/teichoic acid export membrane protein